MELLANEIRLFFEDLESSGAAYAWAVINTHMFSHLVEQLQRYGPMREVWMYAFESFNGYLKRIAKNNAYPVQSIMFNWKRSKVLRLVRGLLLHLERAGNTSRPVAPITTERRPGIRVDVSAEGKRVVLKDDDIKDLKVWMQSAIPAYANLREKWERYVNDARRCVK